MSADASNFARDMASSPSRPIFVIGAQRSGTTLLQSMLGAHANIAAPPEMYYIFRVAKLADYFGSLDDNGNLRRALHEALNPRVPLLAECGFDEDELFECALHRERSYASLLDVILSDFAKRQGKRRWSEKTPNQSAADALRLFADAQLIHIVRDPRDVIASGLETPWEDRGARQLATWWRAFTLDNIRVGRVAGPSRFLQVRYEDMTSDPEGVMRLVCGFLREDYDPSMVDSPERRAATISAAAAPWQGKVLEPITADRHGRHRATLTPSQRASAGAVVRRELAALGYVSPRGVTVAAGTLLNAVLVPGELTRVVGRIRLRRRLRTPEDRYRETKRFLDEVADRLPAL